MAMEMSEHGAPPPEEDFSAIPPIERSVHKNWKARLSAYTDLQAKFARSSSDDDPMFKPFLKDGELLKKWAADSNAAAQEKALEALLEFVRQSGEYSASTRQDVMPVVVDKCFGSARTGTKAKAEELAMLYVEVENGGDGVLGDIYKGFEAKQPKVVAWSVKCVADIVNSFGARPLGSVAAILEKLKKALAHTDKAVRAEAVTLAKAMHVHVGPKMMPFLSDIKEIQLKELTETFAAMDAGGEGGGSGKATRWTRKTQKANEEAAMAGVAGGSGAGDDAALEEVVVEDPTSLIPAVDVVPLLPADFHEVIVSPKWKDKNELLEACLEVLEKHPKLIDSAGLSSYVEALAKRMTDTNINVVQNAAKVLAKLAYGVEAKGFGKYRHVVVPPVLERLKEKKKSVTDTLGATLDAVFLSTTFSDIVDDCVNALASKNPQVREGALSFLARSLHTTIRPPTKDDLAKVATAQVANLGDALEDIRKACADGLGCLMKIFGERALNAYIEPINDLQKAKVQEAFEKAEVRCKAGGGGGGPPPKVALATSNATNKPLVKPIIKTVPPKIAAKAAPGSPPLKASSSNGFGSEYPEDDAPPRAAPKPIARPMVKKPGPSAAASAPPPTAKPTPAASATAPRGGGKTLSGPAPNDPVKFKFSPEDAQAQAEGLINGEIQKGLADAQWKERLAAAESLVAWVDEGGTNGAESEVIFRFLNKTPGWNEKNFQVSAKIYQAMMGLAEKCRTFGRSSAALAIGPLTEKLGDMKLKKPAGDALTVFAEKTSLAFVLAQAYEPMTKQKAPKAQADALAWVKQSILDFGIDGLVLKDLVQFLKAALQSPNGAVRTNATAVLVTVRLYIGTSVTQLLTELNPQLLATINAEFDKVANQPAPEPTRQSADLKEAASGGTVGARSLAADLDSLIPRVDLEKLIATSKVLDLATSENWKERKEALDNFMTVLEAPANSKLKGGMGELAGTLKLRLSDTNLSVKMQALSIISKVAIGMGPPFEKYSRLLAGPTATVLADQKAMTRTAGVATLQAMADACGGLDTLVPGFDKPLDTPNPALRAALLAFMADNFKREAPSKSIELHALVKPLLSCLEDRNGDVRKSAQAVLVFVVARVGYDQVVQETSGLKAASRSTVLPMIQKAREEGAPSQAAAKATGPAAAAPKVVAPKSIAAAVGTTASRPAVAVTAGAGLRGMSGARGMQLKGSMPRPGSALSDTATSEANAAGPSRAPIRKPMGMQRPVSTITPSASSNSAFTATPATPVERAPPLHTLEMDAKAARAKRDISKWSFESGTSSAMLELLQKQMEPHASPDLLAQLFSVDRSAEKDHFAGLAVLEDFYSGTTDGAPYGLSDDIVKDIRLANVDLPLKYASVKLHDGSTQMVLKCIDLIQKVVDFVDRNSSGGFTDVEANVFIPALIFRLGDSKFREKIQGILGHLDRTVPGSKVVSYYQNYGITSANSKTRAASLENLALLIKRRGDVAASPNDGGKLYKKIAEFISSSDNNTRTAALDCLAYLHKSYGAAIYQAIGDIKGKDKDLLEKRIEKLGGQQARAAPISGLPMPKTSPSQAGRSVGTPAKRLSRAVPSEAYAAPSSPRNRAPSAISRPLSDHHESAAPSRNDRDHANGRSSHALQPLSAGGAIVTQRNGTPPRPTWTEAQISGIISSVMASDLDKSVVALKEIQQILEKNPEEMYSHVEDLIEAVYSQLQRAFERRDRLQDPKVFRLTKHLVQTLSNFCDHQNMVERLDNPIMSMLLEQLTSGLLQTDMAEGEVKEMSRFMNMTILRLFATGRRITIFSGLFYLLLRLCKPFTEETPEESLSTHHAELILKCIWKRSRSVEDDLRKGILDAVEMLRIIEEFLVDITPKEWRERAANRVPLGDMPLRTVKVLIQHIVTVHGGEPAYELLSSAFPESAEKTHVYIYIYRLVNKSDDAGQRQSSGETPPSDISPPTHSSPARPSTVKPTSTPSHATTEHLDTELEDAFAILNDDSPDLNKGTEMLHSYFKSHPDLYPQFDQLLDQYLGASTLKLYVKRKLHGLMMNGAGGVVPASASREQIASPARTRPESNISVGSDQEARLLELKNKFAS